MIEQTMTFEELQVCAERLYFARRDHVPIPPLSSDAGLRDAELAYSVQEINTQRWLKEGHRLLASKIRVMAQKVDQKPWMPI